MTNQVHHRRRLPLRSANPPEPRPPLPENSLYLRWDCWSDASYGRAEKLTALRPEVAQWCFEHIGPVHLQRSRHQRESDAPGGYYQPTFGDPYLTFRDAGDMLVFKAKWGSMS